MKAADRSTDGGSNPGVGEQTGSVSPHTTRRLEHFPQASEELKVSGGEPSLPLLI